MTREELAVQLQQLKEYWPKIRERLLAQLLPYKEVKRRLELVGLLRNRNKLVLRESVCAIRLFVRNLSVAVLLCLILLCVAVI